MEQQKPSVGRIVHVILSDSQSCAAAIVTSAHADGSVDLTVFHPSGSLTVEHATTEWHWPERV